MIHLLTALTSHLQVLKPPNISGIVTSWRIPSSGWKRASWGEEMNAKMHQCNNSKVCELKFKRNIFFFEKTHITDYTGQTTV